MATILEFRSERSGLQARGTSRLYVAPAEIVLFPGVRYEYQAAPEEAEAKTKRRSSRKRDKLELKD